MKRRKDGIDCERKKVRERDRERQGDISRIREKHSQVSKPSGL